MKSSIIPQVGDRVGIVCGPCQSPKYDQGTVQTITRDRWYDHIAKLQMDDGRTETWVSAYTTVGIGCYLIERAQVPA